MLNQWIKNKYRSIATPHRIYILAFTSYIAGSILYIQTGHIPPTTTMIISACLFTIGFTIECTPKLKWLYLHREKPYCKLTFILINILIILAVTAQTRSLVANALGLPPQTFDLTVSFLSFALYIPACLLAIACILLVTGIGIFITIVAIAATNEIISVLNIFNLKIVKLRLPIKSSTSFMGLMITSLVFMVGSEHLSQQLEPLIKSSVKYVAVGVDFHPAQNYPGVSANELVHPLENNFIAFFKSNADGSKTLGVRQQSSIENDPIIIYLEPSPNNFKPNPKNQSSSNKT